MKARNFSNFKSKIDFFLPFLFLFILVIIFFWPLVFKGALPYSGDLAGSDLTELNYAFRDYYHQSLQKGEFPLWTHQIAAGYPLAAEGQVGAFYPLNIILYYFLPTLAAFNISLIIHYFLAALFTYLLARSYHLSKVSSWLAGFTFAFSGFLMVHLKHINMVNSAVWLPLMFFLIEKFWLKKKNYLAVLIGVVSAWQILAGHTQIAVYSLFIVFIYYLLREIFDKGKKKIINLGYFIKLLLPWLLIVLVAGGVAMIQILPSRELIKESWREGGLNYQEATVYPFHPRNLITFLSPYFFGNPAKNTYLYAPEEIIDQYGLFWENAGYLGFLTFFLALLGIFFLFKKNKLVRVFTVLLVFSLLLVLGRYTPIFKIIWQIIPFFKLFRLPNRFLLVVDLCLALLAGFGLEYLIQKLRLRLKREYLFIFVSLVFIIIFFDLFYFFRAYNTFLPAQKWLEKPQSVKYLEEDQDRFRIYSFGSFDSWYATYSQAQGWLRNQDLLIKHREVLPPNFHLLFGLSSPIDEFVGLKLMRHWKWQYYFENFQVDSPEKMKEFPKESRLLISSSFLKNLGLSHVKYILSFFNLKGEGLKLVKLINLDEQLLPLRIYQNKYFLPYAFFVPKSKIVQGDKNILQTLSATAFNPFEEIILEESENNTDSNEVGDDSRVEVKEISPKEILLEAYSASPGYVLVSNTFYPGWHVFVDGDEKEVRRANYLFQAVKLDSGSHQVKFIYNPSSYKIGKFISLATLSLIGLYLLFYFLRCKIAFRISSVIKTV